MTARQQAEAEATAAEKEVATGRCAVPPTAARALPGWRARWPPGAAGSRPPRPSSASARVAGRRRAAGPGGDDAVRGARVAGRRCRGGRGRAGRGARGRRRGPRAGDRALTALQEQLERRRPRACRAGVPRRDPRAEPHAQGRRRGAARGGRPARLVGSVAALLAVDPENEEAIVAALGAVADAVAVDSVDAAVDAIRYLRTEDAGRATLLVSGAPTPLRRVTDVPAGRRSRGRPGPCARARRATAVETLLADVVVVDDLAAARAIVATRPTSSSPPAPGTCWSRHRASGGSATAPSAPATCRPALDQARSGGVGGRLRDSERLRFELTGATQARRRRAGARADPGPAERVDARSPRSRSSWVTWAGGPGRECRGRAAAADAGRPRRGRWRPTPLEASSGAAGGRRGEPAESEAAIVEGSARRTGWPSSRRSPRPRRPRPG